jgi:hypothetical protein
MNPLPRARRSLLAYALPLCLASGCAITVAGPTPPAIEPPAPTAFQPRVEHTVGDFAFTLEGGKMVTSNVVGRSLSELIMAAWAKRGYISSAAFVDSGAFTHDADYELTLSGSQYGESSIFLQIVCGLTFFLTPYTVTQNYDVQYVLVDRRGGRHYSAAIQGQDKAWVQLFLLFALPVANRGHEETVGRIAEHLYQQLRDQGAFQPAAPAPAEPPPTEGS